MYEVDNKGNQRVKDAIMEDATEVITRAYGVFEDRKQREAEFKILKEDLAFEIADVMKKLGTKDFTAVANKFSNKTDEDINCKLIESQSVEYLPEKLKENFDKEFCNEVLLKTYTVVDMAGLIELLKSNGVKFGDFKKFIDVKETVDEKKLDQLFDLGDITMKDLKGCYKITQSKGYWKVSSKKTRKDD